MKLGKVLGVVVSAFVLLLGPPARADAGGRSDEDACVSYLNAGDWQRAASAGQRGVNAGPTRGAALCLGRALEAMGEFDLALSAFKKAESLSSTDQDLATVYSWLGGTVDSMGDLESAELYYSRALALSRRLKDRGRQATDLNNLGTIFRSRGALDKSLKYYREAIDLAATNDQKAIYYNNIAITLSDSHKYKESAAWLQKALAIQEHAGDYQRLARSRLNLGDDYRLLGDFAGAETTLGEGLAATLQGGDKYWQAVAYQYQGWLRKDQKRLEDARALFARAADLASSIGAKPLARSARADADEISQALQVRTYAGIDIGSKGVKALVVDIQKPLGGGWDYHVRYRASENTDLMSGTQNGEARAPAIEATAQAVAKFVRLIRDEQKIPFKDIAVLGSSGAGRATNRSLLVDRVKQLCGAGVAFASAQQEAIGNLAGSVPGNLYRKSVAIDIGSANTKIAYLYEQDQKLRAATFEVPFGTVSLTEAVHGAQKEGEDFAHALDRFVSDKVRPDLSRRVKLYPTLAQRSGFYWVGGAVWAFSSFSHPADDSSPFLQFKPEDVRKFQQRLRSGGEAALSPSLDDITDPSLRERANQQLAAVRKAFTRENILAGTKLMDLLVAELKVLQRPLTFSRNGSWVLGHLMLEN